MSHGNDGNSKKQETTEIQVSLTMGILFGFLFGQQVQIESLSMKFRIGRNTILLKYTWLQNFGGKVTRVGKFLYKHGSEKCLFSLDPKPRNHERIKENTPVKSKDKVRKIFSNHIDLEIYMICIRKIRANLPNTLEVLQIFKKKNTAIEKWAKNMSRLFHRKKIQVALKHIMHFRMQIKIIMRYHFLSIMLAQDSITFCWQGYRKKGTLLLLEYE